MYLYIVTYIVSYEQKRHYEDDEGNEITRKRMKKLRRISRRPEKNKDVQVKRGSDKCSNCANTLVNIYLNYETVYYITIFLFSGK